MLTMVLAFAPVAALLTVTPGVGTALVVRSAATGGRGKATRTIVGNEIGVLTWALLAAVGVAAVVAASAEAFTVIKLIGAAVLIVIGIQSLLARGEAPAVVRARDGSPAPLRLGLVTAISNPKLAVFFVALFPQFVPDGAPVLPAALLMAALLVVFDFAWYSVIAWLVTRAKRAFVEGPWMRRVERLTGGVLVALGVRLAFEKR
jgi:threonine/homoserine/homoserine lactone efflux protein